MIKNNISALIWLMLLALVAGTLSACNEEKVEYIPGEPDSANCMGVYFDENNEQDFIFIPGEPAEVSLLMHRKNTASAADVTLVVSCEAAGITYPNTVHFDAGSADAVAVLDFSQLPEGQKVKFSVDVPEEYISKYAATLFNYESTALISQWVPANADGSPVKFYFTSTNYINSSATPESAVYQPLESEMDVLPVAGMIRIKNFLNSGSDIRLSLTPSPYADYAGYYRVSPLDHDYSMAEAYENESYGDEWYNAWFLLDAEEEDYTDANLIDLDGNPSVLGYPYFFWYSDSYQFEYSYANLKAGSSRVSMGLSGTPADGLSLPMYFYLFFSWTGETGL